METEKKYIDVCAGCGGLSCGFEMANLKPLCMIEIDKTCCKTLEKNFTCEIINKDMREVDPKKFRDRVDLVVGGIPCQSFSMSGKRQGLQDVKNGGLFFVFLGFLKDIEPKMFLIENVEGLKSIDKGQTFNLMLEELEKAGYNIYNKVLNSLHYFVPQKRKRLIIVGIKKTYSVKFEFPTESGVILTMRDALADVPDSEGVEYSERKKRILSLVPQGGCWVDLPEDVKKEYMGKSINSGGGKRGTARRMAWDEPCLTLTTSPCQKQTERCHPNETRPLKIREYARIQTFPDDFIFEGTTTSIYRQIGNAVPCKLAYFLGVEIEKSLTAINAKSNSIVINENRRETPLNSIHTTIFFLVQRFVNEYIKPIYRKSISIKEICVDEIKKAIDISMYNITEDEWLDFEKRRIIDKRVNNKIGELHEFVLSRLDGWEKVGRSNDISIKKLHADIFRTDKTVFLEIKNKYNTMNSSSRKTTLNNLKEIKKMFPDATVGIGIVNGKNYKKSLEGDIFEFSGEALSEIVIGEAGYRDIILKSFQSA